MSSMIVAGLPNVLANVSQTLSSGVAATSGFPLSNLQTDEPSDKARLPSTVPSETYFEFVVSVASMPYKFNVASLIGHNFQPGARVRFIAWVPTPATIPIVSETLAPTAFEATTNVTGAVTDIDEGVTTPDGAALSPTVTSSTMIFRTSFATPTANPATGDDWNAFVLRLRRQGTASSETDYPRVQVELYDAGVLKANLGLKVVKTTSYHNLIFPWDGAALTTASGAGLEVRVTCFPGAVSANTYIQVDTLDCDLMDAADLTASTFVDTGWTTVAGATAEAAWGDTALTEVSSLPLPVWWSTAGVAAASPVQVTRARFEIRADGVPFFDDWNTTPAREAASYVEAGVAQAGPSFEFPYQFAPGGELKFEHETLGGELTLGGQSFSVNLYSRRVATTAHPDLTESAAISLAARIDYATRSTKPFLVSLEPDATNELVRLLTTYWCTATGKGYTYVQGLLDGETRRANSYEWTEKL